MGSELTGSIQASTAPQTPFPMAALPLLDNLTLAQVRIILRLARLQWGLTLKQDSVKLRQRKLSEACGLSLWACQQALQEMARPMPKRGIPTPLIHVDGGKRKIGKYSLLLPGANFLARAQSVSVDLSNFLTIPNEFIDRILPASYMRILDVRVYLRLRMLAQAGETEQRITGKWLNEEPVLCHGGAVHIKPLAHWRVSMVDQVLERWADFGLLRRTDDGYLLGGDGTETKQEVSDTQSVACKTQQDACVKPSKRCAKPRQLCAKPSKLRAKPNKSEVCKTQQDGSKIQQGLSETQQVRRETQQDGSETTQELSKTQQSTLRSVSQSLLLTDRHRARTHAREADQNTPVIIRSDDGDDLILTLGEIIDRLATLASPESPTRYKASLLRKAREHGIALVDGDEHTLNIGAVIDQLQKEQAEKRARNAIARVRSILDAGKHANLVLGDKACTITELDPTGAETVDANGRKGRIPISELHNLLKAGAMVEAVEPPPPAPGSIEWVSQMLASGKRPMWAGNGKRIEVISELEGQYEVLVNGAARVMGPGTLMIETLNLTPEAKAMPEDHAGEVVPGTPGWIALALASGCIPVFESDEGARIEIQSTDENGYTALIDGREETLSHGILTLLVRGMEAKIKEREHVG